MNYRYKGTNGSMGLITGNKYMIHTETEGEKVFANVFLTSDTVKVGAQEYAGKAPDVQFMPYVFVPYDNAVAFKANWIAVGDCRCTNPGDDDGSTTCWQHHDCSDGSCTHQDND